MKAEFTAAKLKGLKDTERVWQSSSSILPVPSVLPPQEGKGRYHQPVTQLELPDLELFFYPQKFWRSPHTSSWRHSEGARCAVCACVCKLHGGGEMLTACPYLSVKSSENKGCYFSLVQGLKYGDSTQSTKNILPYFKLRGTQPGQQTLKTLELEHSGLPKQSHAPKIHISRKYISWIK